MRPLPNNSEQYVVMHKSQKISTHPIVYRHSFIVIPKILYYYFLLYIIISINNINIKKFRSKLSQIRMFEYSEKIFCTLWQLYIDLASNYQLICNVMLCLFNTARKGSYPHGKNSKALLLSVKT